MQYDDSNIFACILRGELPCHKVFEDEEFLVLMDIMPQAPGHTLILPKMRVVTILDAQPATLANMMKLAQRVAKAQISAFAAEGTTVFIYSGEAGGQSVFHLHLHVVPRKRGVNLIQHGAKREKDKMLAQHADRIRTHLN